MLNLKDTPVLPAQEKDYPEIYQLVENAFQSKQEVLLIDNLRKNPRFQPELSLIARYQDKIIGYILFFPIDISRDNKIVAQPLALSPMAVLPLYQRTQLGGTLISSGLLQAKNLGFSSVIVLGHRDYYPRFGFQPASDFGIMPPFEVPKEVFFALELQRGSLHGKSGMVIYPPEFSL